MVRRGATTMFILSKSFAFCSEGIPSGKDAPKDDQKWKGCALLTMNSIFQLRNIS